jgi:hypothetical protein
MMDTQWFFLQPPTPTGVSQGSGAIRNLHTGWESETSRLYCPGCPGKGYPGWKIRLHKQNGG